MIKIVNKRWWCNGTGVVGAVLGYDENTKEHKLYIGVGTGLDEDLDTDKIRDYGTKITSPSIINGIFPETI